MGESGENEISSQEAEPFWSAIRGKYCWNVAAGIGSFFTMEFGSPELLVREALDADRLRQVQSERSRAHLSRRKVIVKGEWSLWIYQCAWRILVGGSEACTSSTDRGAMDSCLREVDGRTLERLRVEPSTAMTFFYFEGGLVLECGPSEPSDGSQWILSFADGAVLSYTNDGRWMLEPSA